MVQLHCAGVLAVLFLYTGYAVLAVVPGAGICCVIRSQGEARVSVSGSLRLALFPVSLRSLRCEMQAGGILRTRFPNSESN